MTISLNSPHEVQQGIAGRLKARRLALNLTQQELAERSGVTWASLRRFEREGLISLDSLLKLALVLGCLNDFEKLCEARETVMATQTLDALLTQPSARKRASGRKGQKYGL